MDLRNVWIVRGTLDGPSGTLSTSVTVSGVTTLIDGSEIRVVVPEPASLGYEIVTSNLAFQTGKPYAFNFGECFFIDADGHEPHFRFVSDSATLTVYVHAHTGA